MEDNNSPRWVVYVAGMVAGLVPTAVALIGLWFLFLKKRRNNSSEEQAAVDERVAKKKALADERITKIRREAMQEAKAAIDQVNLRLEEQEEELKALREMLRRCETDRAMLRLVVAWAKDHKMPMTPELDELLKETVLASETAAHRPL